MLRRAGTAISRVLIIVMLSLVVCNSYAQTAEEEALKKGVDLIRHDKFDEAIAEFNNVITVNPKSTSAHYNLGFAYDKKGDLDKAILSFSKAVEIDPTLADAYYNRGFAYYKKGAFDNAITDYNKVIEISPSSADAYYGLGLVYSHKGDLNKAIVNYTKAIEIRPNFALAYDARAVAYVTKNNYIGAMADVNKAQSLGFRSRPLKRAPADLTNTEKSPANLPASEPKQGGQMQALALKTTGFIFLLVSFLHLLRLIFKIKVMVGKFTVPVWFSAAGFIIPLLLSFWIFKSLNLTAR
ncbi:MAG: tetratricopeptide repeat protein [Candidatus Omnitrophica bacterium]|nr:tetratricopeptide repeat protein [Candidatus Omnitrophota bacterium]